VTESLGSRLRVGVLGAGPIAQFAHFEGCAKARNAELFAICDVADDLLSRMDAIWRPRKTYDDFDRMLADPEVEAIIVATADTFHVPASIAALQAGKHVLCEKPVATNVEDVLKLADEVARSGKVYQIGHMKRFDPGIQSAKTFIDNEMGEMQAIKAWYCDSTHRYTVTDAVQPKPITTSLARKPKVDPRTDRAQYYMLAHGSHLVDLARFLGGEVKAVQARRSERFGAYCWFVDVDYASGALGHIDLTVAVRMDWHEGFQVYGQHGAIIGKIFNPWYFRSSDVDIFREDRAESSRVLGADGHFYRRQLESFADVILSGREMTGASIDDGVACVRAMAAIRQSLESSGRSVDLSEAHGSA